MAASDEPTASPQQALVLVLGGMVTRAGIPELCERLRELLHGSDADCVVCDVGALTDPDLAAVEAIVRLRLTAGRLGRQFRLCRESAGLRDLLALTGLCEALRFQPGGQAEQREQPRGVEERVEPGDPPG
jgi:anti-anti-sigma regulatory factor